MSSRLHGSVYFIAVVVMIAVLALMGCPKRPGSAPTGEGASAGQQAEAADQSASEVEPVGGQQEETEATRRLREAVGAQEPLTQEDVDKITAYGVFQFPGSELVAESSLRQMLPEGTEIYRLEFGTNTAMNAVADWYRDHLEPGFEEKPFEGSGDIRIAGFEYESPDGTWKKTITLTGPAVGDWCRMTVSLVRKAPIPAGGDTSESGSG